MKFTTVKVLVKDIKRMDKLKIHKTEPRWSVVERILNEKYERNVDIRSKSDKMI